MQQLNQQDAMFLYSETPRMLMHLGSLHLYDATTAPDPITFENIVEHVRGRLPLARVLRRRIVRVPGNLDYPYWVESEDFDLEFHVRQTALPPPGNLAQLWTLASRLHSYGLDLQRPPWELYIIQGVNDVEGLPRGSFGMLIKVHHSAIDGISGIELMNALHDLTPDGRAPVADTWEPEAKPGPIALLTRAGVNLTLMPGRALQLAARSASVLRSGARPAATGADVPETALNGKATTNRVGDGFRFALATAKRVRGAVPGATVNDVVLAVVGGGLRKYLEAWSELPERSLYAGVPISMRTEEDLGQPGNKIGMMVVPVSTDVADPLKRLDTIRQATSTSKEQSTAVPARVLADSAELFPGALLGAATRALPQLGPGGLPAVIGNVCVTNVPGSQEPLYLCGARMEAYYGLGPVYDHAGPIHLVVSYVGQIYLGVTSCRELVPDMAFYIECLTESLAELEVAADAALAPPRKATRARATTPAKKRAVTKPATKRAGRTR